MKKLRFLFLLVIVFLCSTASFVAFAEDANYIKIENDNVGFYMDDEEGFFLVFYLPQNTYAMLLPTSLNSYYSISYNGINGLIKKTEVPAGLFSDVSNPYSDKQITLKEPKIYFASDNLNNPLTLLPTDTLMYIGQITKDNILYYAVKKNSDTSIYFVKYNDVYIPEPVDDTPEPPADPVQPDNNLIKVLLIIGIIIPAVIMVFLLFKPRRRKPRSRRYVEDEPTYRRRDEDYYDDNDYY